MVPSTSLGGQRAYRQADITDWLDSGTPRRFPCSLVVPRFVALAHELIHAARNMAGVNEITGTATGQDLVDEHAREENATVGPPIPPLGSPPHVEANGIPTENGIRDDHTLPRRQLGNCGNGVLPRALR